MSANESTDAQPGEARTTLAERVPAGFFSIAVGIAGLGNAWLAAAAPLGITPRIGQAVVTLAAVLWLALASAYGLKWRRAPEHARAEWCDPLQSPFVGLIPASLLLVLPAFVPLAMAPARWLFGIAAAVQVILSAAIVARWISQRTDAESITPAWHLAVVAGQLFAAIAAAAAGLKLTGWCFFGAGVLWWLLIEMLVLPRLVRGEPLPAPLRPQLAVELAPPAVVVLAYLALVDGEVDAIALGVFGYALFIAIALALAARHLLAAPFGPSWWAFTFPFAALSGAAWRIALSNGSEGAFALAAVLFGVANAVVLGVAARSVLALSRGEFIPPR